MYIGEDELLCRGGWLCMEYCKFDVSIVFDAIIDDREIRFDGVLQLLQSIAINEHILWWSAAINTSIAIY